MSHKNLEHKSAKDNPLVFWIVGESDTTGRRLIYGYKPTIEEARKAVAGIHNADCEIIPFNGTNEDDFSRHIRGKVLEETGDIDSAYKRFDHRDRV